MPDEGTVFESKHYEVGLDETVQLDEAVDAKPNYVRELSDKIQIGDAVGGDAKISIIETLREWIVIFFCMIVIVSVSGALVPFPVNIVVGIVGGMCGVVIADRYGTSHVTRKDVKIEPSDS